MPRPASPHCDPDLPLSSVVVGGGGRVRTHTRRVVEHAESSVSGLKMAIHGSRNILLVLKEGRSTEYFINLSTNRHPHRCVCSKRSLPHASLRRTCPTGVLRKSMLDTRPRAIAARSSQPHKYRTSYSCCVPTGTDRPVVLLVPGWPWQASLDPGAVIWLGFRKLFPGPAIFLPGPRPPIAALPQLSSEGLPSSS